MLDWHVTGDSVRLPVRSHSLQLDPSVAHIT